MKILVDVSLSPEWGDALSRGGVESVHGSTVGDLRAPDAQILGWARERGFWVLTYDLDFGAILASTSANAPSVLQLRSMDVLPDRMASVVLQAIEEYRDELEAGALIRIDEVASRARILPLLRR